MKEVLGIKLYTYQEVADLLEVHSATIARYVKQGRMAAKLIGRTNYISEPEIKNFILKKEEETEA